MDNLLVLTLLLKLIVVLWLKVEVEGMMSVIDQKTGNVVRIIEDRNIRSMSDELEGYIIVANPLNVCEIPQYPPLFANPASSSPKPKVDASSSSSKGPPLRAKRQFSNFDDETVFPPYDFAISPPVEEAEEKKLKWILLGVIYDCDLTTKAKNAVAAGYSGLIIQNIGTNNSQLIPWHIMRFPLAKINHVVVGEYDGFLLRYNYSYPDNAYYVKFDEDHLYQILCYVLAAIILLLLSTMFFLFWFQICCTIVSLQLPYRIGQRFRQWLRPAKRRLNRQMLALLPVRNWTEVDPFVRCSICQEDFNTEDKVRILPCVHAFHPGCIDQWLLKRSRRCPNCMRWVKLPNEPEPPDYDLDDDDTSSSSSSSQQSSNQLAQNQRQIRRASRSHRSSSSHRSCHSHSRHFTHSRQAIRSATLGRITRAEIRRLNELDDARLSTPLDRSQIRALLEIPDYPKHLQVPRTTQPRVLEQERVLINNNNTTLAPLTTPAQAPSLRMINFLQQINASDELSKNVSNAYNSQFKPCPRITAVAVSASLPHSKSMPLQNLQVLPVDPSSSVKKIETRLLETCLDIPANPEEMISPVFGVEEQQMQQLLQLQLMEQQQTTDPASQSVSILMPRREYSNPGYISEDDDEDDDADATTEEANLSSSADADATTVSESLPRDESFRATGGSASDLSELVEGQGTTIDSGFSQSE